MAEHTIQPTPDPMKPRKHQAEQIVSPIVDPPVKLSLTLLLEGETARRWRQHQAFYQGINPSNAQLVTALLKRGLAEWEASKGKAK